MKKLYKILGGVLVLATVLFMAGNVYAATFGYTSAGANRNLLGNHNDFAGEFSAGLYNMPVDGTVSKLTVYVSDPRTVVSGDAGSGTIYGAIYDTSFNRIGSVSSGVTVDVGIAGPVAVDIPLSVSLTAGNYYLAVWGTNPNYDGVSLYGETTGGTSRQGNGSYSQATHMSDNPVTSASLTSDTIKFSISATYTATASPTDNNIASSSIVMNNGTLKINNGSVVIRPK